MTINIENYKQKREIHFNFLNFDQVYLASSVNYKYVYLSFLQRMFGYSLKFVKLANYMVVIDQ